MGARGKTAVSVRVEGLRELDANLAQLTKATARNVMKRSLMGAGEIMVAHAKRLVPVETGRLKDAIIAGGKVEAAGAAEYSQVLSSGGSKADAVKAMRNARRQAGGSYVEIHCGVSRMAFYAHFVEFGTHRTAPRPFIRPAFDAEKNAMVDAIKRDLAANIQKAVSRMQRRAARAAAKGK